MSTYGPDSGKPFKENIHECFKCGNTWTAEFFQGDKPAAQEWVREMYEAAEQDAKQKHKYSKAKQYEEQRKSSGSYKPKTRYRFDSRGRSMDGSKTWRSRQKEEPKKNQDNRGREKTKSSQKQSTADRSPTPMMSDYAATTPEVSSDEETESKPKSKN